MAQRINEMIRIEPLINVFTTAAATSTQKINVSPNVDKIGIMCQVACSSNLSTGVTSTAAMSWAFQVLEGTAATAGGSAVSSAAVTLGAATAGQVRGAYSVILKVTSNLTSVTTVSINGISYQTTVTGVGKNGEDVAALLASAINGNATSNKLPHYVAVANYSATGQVLIEPSDDAGTGLTIDVSGAGSTIVPLMVSLQGMIEISGDKWSTNTPKYVGVSVTPLTGASTSICNAFLVRNPMTSPAFPGKVVMVTT